MIRAFFLVTTILIIMLSSTVCLGTITYGGSIRGASFSSSTNSLTFSSTVVAGSQRLGLVLVGNGNVTTGMAITWNGVSMTEIPGAYMTANSEEVHIFYLIAPALGSTTIAVSTTTNWNLLFCTALLLNGVNQTAPIDTAHAVTGAASVNFSTTGTTNRLNEYVVDSIVQNAGAATLAATAPAVRDQNGNNGNFAWGSSHQSVSAISSPTVAWSSGNTATWIEGNVSIIPAQIPHRSRLQ